MVITTLNVNANFKYFWLKKINGIDLNKHCAKCLLGDYIDTKHVVGYELPDGIYYLCGVAYPYIWSNNFHLAFTQEVGNTVELDHNGVHVIVEGARQLPISMDYCDKRNPKYGYKSYRTCRNWQFANYLKQSGLL